MDRACSVPSKNTPLAVLALSVSLLAATGGSARASQLLDRNARAVHLQVNAKGQALITYRTGGRVRGALGRGEAGLVPPRLLRRLGHLPPAPLAGFSGYVQPL